MRIVFLNVEIDAPPPVIQMNYCESCGTWFYPSDVDGTIHAIIDYVDRYYDGQNVPVPTDAELDVHSGKICSAQCFEDAS